VSIRGDRGSITIVAAAVMALVVVLTMGAADVGTALVAQAHAQQVADAAALAAAQELVLPSGHGPAGAAADYALRNGGTLTACACAAGSTEAVVTVHVAVPHLLLLPGARTVTARARAVIDPPRPAVP
jgi:secretion/DNA translocation related TadE-like protein